MTSHTGRLYALALALVVLFATWTAIATRPWVTQAAAADPRWTALAAREQRLRHESIVVNRLVKRRWAVYRVDLRARNAQIAAARRAQVAADRQAQVAAQHAQAAAAQAAAAPVAATAPAVRVVTLPPLTITRTS
jgi:hypothetical protein